MTETTFDRWGFPVREVKLAKPVETPKRRGTQAGFGSFSSATLDAGLQRLCARQAPFQTFTRVEIARECGVSKDTIRLLERQALRKLMARLGSDNLSQARELLASFDSTKTNTT